MIPKMGKTITVSAPEKHISNAQDSKALYQIQTKLKRTFFKVDAQNPTIFIDVCIYFNNKLSSKEGLQRPFMFSMPLNFSTKEQVQSTAVTFDFAKIEKHIKIEDFQQGMLKAGVKQCKDPSMEEPDLDLDYHAIPTDFKVE